MPQPKKASDESTLPQRELNPLLNPLLAANMGRWAEVYFTSAPERREQAVADLLRELESNSPSETSSSQHVSGQRSFLEEIDRVDHDDHGAPVDHGDAIAMDSPPESLPVLHCSACEAVNWLGQRFCGMCGATLPLTPYARSAETEEVLPVATTSWTEHGLSPREELVEHASEPEAGPTISEVSPTFFDVADGGDEAPEPAWHSPDDLPAFAREPEPVPYRYRAYIGIVLSILLVGLVYLAWRHGISGTGSTPQSAPLPAMPAERTTSPAPAESGAKQSATPTPTPAPPAAQNPAPHANLPKAHAAATRKAIPAPPSPASSSTTSAAQSGNAELLVAEKFLKGSPGTVRDSKEAATWLWKAVSKQNIAAALLLSDLYVRGDGVPKSCVQARLLLDAAARKGEAAAAEQLRNLQNFGCQ
ncbi:MAG: hypothetical protein WAN65_05725 [Candidatus Sulfotelmatobacter sp.]